MLSSPGKRGDVRQSLKDPSGFQVPPLDDLCHFWKAPNKHLSPAGQNDIALLSIQGDGQQHWRVGGWARGGVYIYLVECLLKGLQWLQAKKRLPCLKNCLNLVE